MMFPIPGILAVLYFIWENAYALFVAKISFVLSGLILGLFFCLLMLELKQDKKIDKYFTEHKNVKIEIGDNTYECGACGCRSIRRDSTFCVGCGCEYISTSNLLKNK